MFTIVYLGLYRPSLMIIALRTQFHVERPWGQCPFSIVSYRVSEQPDGSGNEVFGGQTGPRESIVVRCNSKS